MKVSIVTPNYNGEKFLKTFFESLDNDSELIGEVIIVDNGSTDKSKEYIKSNAFNFPHKTFYISGAIYHIQPSVQSTSCQIIFTQKLSRGQREATKILKVTTSLDTRIGMERLLA